MFANVIIDISHEKLDRTFQYKVPEHLLGKLREGMEVQVPFGRGNTLRKAYIMKLTQAAEFPEEKMKAIARISEKGMTVEEKQVELAVWLRSQYGGTMVQALKTVLPVKQKIREKRKEILTLRADREIVCAELEDYRRKHYKAKVRLLEALLEMGSLDREIAAGKLNIAKSTIDSLIEAGLIRLEEDRVYRNPLAGMELVRSEKLTLNEEQQSVVKEIRDAAERKEYSVFLLHGVTGSGKTEVYMELIDGVIRQGKQAIMLIPEIALTFQTVSRFYKRFGAQVSILHSRLSQGERYDQFERAKKGEIQIMIGPRSALFTPFSNLGVIIIDEEHESSYKSETIPCYQTREVAKKRAKQEGAYVVLGSATPSVESYYRCQQGEYKLCKLNKRVENRTLPKVHIVDLREELKIGNRSILSRKLEEEMKCRLEKKEQMMLFLNRRGYVGFISCRSCGEVIKCPHCDVSLYEHKGTADNPTKRLICHYCGFTREAVSNCPSCGSRYIGGFRAGTQQIEDVVKKTFPGVRVLRMDYDTTREKDSYQQILESFANGEADVLIGTQMIVKGHDFPGVTLVGILAADISLYSSHFSAAERTFQLLTQAAGRAGRGEKEGEVVIQTYKPEHYSIQTAKKQDYDAFYEEEILYRRLGGYPPAEEMMAVYFFGKQEDTLQKAAMAFKEEAEKLQEQETPVHLIGPADCPVAKINDIYRKVLYLKQEKAVILLEMKEKLEPFAERLEQEQNIQIQFDYHLL